MIPIEERAVQSPIQIELAVWVDELAPDVVQDDEIKEDWIARTASSTGFSVKWTMDCGLTFLIDQTSVALSGPRNLCPAP